MGGVAADRIVCLPAVSGFGLIRLTNRSDE